MTKCSSTVLRQSATMEVVLSGWHKNTLSTVAACMHLYAAAIAIAIAAAG